MCSKVQSSSVVCTCMFYRVFILTIWHPSPSVRVPGCQNLQLTALILSGTWCFINPWQQWASWSMYCTLSELNELNWIEYARAGSWRTRLHTPCSDVFTIHTQSTRVRTCIPYWRALSGGRCRGSSATPFQFIFIIDCQPHTTPYRRWPRFPGRRCTCLEQSARSCHFRTFRSSLLVPA